MAKYNLINKKGEVVNIVDAPDNEIMKLIAGNEYTYELLPEPEPLVVVQPTEPTMILVSPVEFKLLFTSPERIAISSARATDPVLDDFFSIIDDVRLTTVNLALQSTKEALSYLVSQKFITENRKKEILTGVVK